MIGGVRLIILLALLFVYLRYVLALFPWTRATSYRLDGYIFGPLETMGRGLANQIPSVLFLASYFFLFAFC